MVGTFDQRVAESRAFLEASPDVGKAGAVVVDERVHGRPAMWLPVAAYAHRDQIRALLPSGFAESGFADCASAARALNASDVTAATARPRIGSRGMEFRNRGVGCELVKRSGKVVSHILSTTRPHRSDAA